ncbi:MAG: YlmH/Sll1252 family protein [Negativicutes bacterium]|nr:YlmH/Sll1252 family protein [Negativicutes bacterium]
MSEREKILRFYRASGDDDLAARLLDLAEGALKGRKYRVTEFLDPYGYTIAETVAAHFDRLRLEANGGYQGAERVKAAFVDEDFDGKVIYNISLLAVKWDKRYYHISHRDILGSLMALGIKREMLGDIIMTGEGCQVIVDAAMRDFLSSNLLKIGAAPVSVVAAELTEIVPREEKTKEIRTTVASLRLDVIAAAGFGTSRTKMAAEIAADKLKVNWQDAKNSAQAVKAGDVISMRGRGRLEICEILGQTKKGRFSVLLKRYI